MSRPSKRGAPFPGRDAIVAFIREGGRHVGKREIARAFGLDAAQKVHLKKVLREIEDEGLVERRRGRRLAAPGTLPEVAVIEVTGTDADGDVLARPVSWDDDHGTPPLVRVAPERRPAGALGPGARVLARLEPDGERGWRARVIRRLAEAPAAVLGVFRAEDGGHGRIVPSDRRAKGDLLVGPADSLGAETGDLVRAVVLPARRLGLRHARVVERLEQEGARAASLIAIHEHGLPARFSAAAVAEAEAARAAPVDGREDLRALPLVTIDGSDARDFDDAVFAEADPDPANPGGWRLVVAIADVAWYVRPGSALDGDAHERGNSAYFPDRVVPMLPEALSNGWCSLNPGEDRPCLAAHLTIGADGNLVAHRFARAVMRSAARLTYGQVQRARDGLADDVARPLMDRVIAPLYGAYAALAKARRKRGVLELDLPERRVALDDAGNVVRIETRERFDSHRLIEEFMIAANVAAAETLEERRQPCMYRIHDSPSLDKLEALRQFLDSLGLRLAKGQVLKAASFNRILERAAATPNAHLVNEVVLRSQAQAEYAPGNIGHFGLALRRYCHFTSPIRRYADLLVHRALIRGLGLGAGALEGDPPDFVALGEHISATERRAAAAERDAVARFVAAFLAERVGATFKGRIGGVARFGLFVTLAETGADGLVPVSTLPSDYYLHDESAQALVGRERGRVYRLGDDVEVRLREANPVSGGIILEVLDEGAPAPRPRRGRARPGRR